MELLGEQLTRCHTRCAWLAWAAAWRRFEFLQAVVARVRVTSGRDGHVLHATREHNMLAPG
jgi:hypothetical protein